VTALTVSTILGGGFVSLPGAMLAVRSKARVAGVLFVLTGVSMALAGAATGQDVSAAWAEIITLQIAGLALMAYPQLTFPDPATWIAALVVISLPPVALSGGHDTAAAAWLCVVLVPVTQVWWRLETGGQARRPLVWLLAAAITLTLVGALAVVSTSSWALAGFFTIVPLLPLAAWMGVARPQVVDVRGVISMLAINVTAGLGLFAVIMLVTALWSEATGHEMDSVEITVVAVGCAFLLQPVRRQLRLVSDELLFGIRPDPLAAAGSLASGIGGDPGDALDAVRSSLVLPYAVLKVEGAPVTESGIETDHVATLPLSLNGQCVGELLIGLRAGDLRLPAADAKVLHVAGPLLAQTARAHALASRLQEGREMAANAREDERFRLRRDLHDGLGPRLAAIAFRIGAAQLRLAPGEDAVAEHLARVRSEAVAAIQEIRDLVYGMRPPAIDEVGLVEAIRLQADELRTPDGEALRLDLVADDLRDLPAAVEVAAYRIVTEALTNAARHSGSVLADARLVRANGALDVEVRDGGATTGPWRPGVGIASMRERAQELGGTLTITGGYVQATLPLG
jgi:two-component system NarL family sensor kinase